MDTKNLAKRIRIHSLKMINRGGGSHVGSALSIADILAVLYGEVLHVDPNYPLNPDRDRFILSKGHAGAAIYAVLAERGFISKEKLKTYYKDGSDLCGHANHKGIPGVEISTGSLGHGLSIAIGMALDAKMKKRGHRIFALLSDGECDEGSTWEAIMFASHHKLENLIAIVDYNKIQALGHTKEVVNLEPFNEKWQAFGWEVREVNGHDITELTQIFEQIPFKPNKPSVVIAHTIKGKGVSFMEDNLLWHYRCPKGEEYEVALRELEENQH